MTPDITEPILPEATLPFVSVIIPVFNDTERLLRCLEALEQQTYPGDRYEVIVVDNNSDEPIESSVAAFQHVKVLFEAQPGSYAARNCGLAMARGDVFAFTDSDCLPQPGWIANGIRALMRESADLAGGQITFEFSSRRTAAELYDSITHMRNKRDITTRNLAKTANLLVQRHVFEAIGLFPSEVRSGGDVIWTKKATDAQFKLVYAADAEVFHPTRGLLPLLQKQYRTGYGQPKIWLEQGQSIGQVIARSLINIRPPSVRNLQQAIDTEGTPDMHHQFVSIWLVAWLCSVVCGLGRLSCIGQELVQKQS